MHNFPFLSEDTDLIEFRLTAFGLAPPPTRKRRKRKPATSDGLHDIAATASRLGVTQEKVRAFVRDGDLKFINVGHGRQKPRYRFTNSDINEFIEKRKTQETPCPSSRLQRARRISGTGSRSSVVGFMEARAAHLARKPKNLKR